MSLHARQGDLLFVQRDFRPTAPLTTRQGDIMVACEATGHAHRLQAGLALAVPDGAHLLDRMSMPQMEPEELRTCALAPATSRVIRRRQEMPAGVLEGKD